MRPKAEMVSRTNAGASVRERPTAAAASRWLAGVREPEYARGLQRFFKTAPGEYGEGDRFLGVRMPTLRKAARLFEALPLSQVKRLMPSEWHEERMLALLILVRQYARADDGLRDTIFRFYLEHLPFINNWDLVDLSADHIVGRHLRDGDRSPLHELAQSPVLWERRVAVLATFHYIKRGEFDETLALAALLLEDREDLIHKAVGWMLREIGKRDLKAEEAFLRRYHRVMPRTMLRYAIERFPPEKRAHYMS